MNNKKVIILSIAFLLIVSVLIIFKNGMWEKTTVLSTKKVEDTEKKLKGCFLTKTNSDLLVSEKTGFAHNIKYLEIVKGKGSKVEGLINYLHTEKDSVKGTFVGVLQDGYMNIIFSRTGEGDEWKEQKIFKVYEDLVIESEYSEKELVEGVYVFKEIEKVVFGNDGIFSNVNCTGVDKKEVGLEWY